MSIFILLCQTSRGQRWIELTVYSKIIQDVGPTLLPDEEISDLAAAEGAVNEKVAERNATVEKLGEEFRRASVFLLRDRSMSFRTDT